MMKHVLHIEMPRALTAGVREFDVRAFLQLEKSNVKFSQVDINSRFWKFIFRKYAPQFEGSICAIFESDTLHVQDYLTVASGLILIGEQLLPLGLNIKTSGLFPTEESKLSSSSEIRDVLCGPIRDLINDFIAQTDAYYCFEKFDLISIGITGKNSFLLAFGIADYLQLNHPEVKLCVGKHHYENFSFLLTLDKILHAKTLFYSFPFISLYEEKMGDMILGILSGDQNQFTNTAWLNNDQVFVRQPGGKVSQFNALTEGCKRALLEYISDADIVPSNIHYNMQLVGNQCYYSRCTFCAQINKHIDKTVYEENEAVTLSVAVIEELHKSGVYYFSFTDEALRPADLLRLTKAIEKIRLRIIWNMRLIANTRLTSDLIEKLYQCGCREILFGLETIDTDMARVLGKVSSGDDLGDITNLVFACTHKGIGVVLSMIYGLPGFTEQKESELIEYASRMLIHNPLVLFIFNRFELFGGTVMYREPERFGITFVEAQSSGADLDNSYKFQPVTISKRSEVSFQILNLHPCVKAEEVMMSNQMNDLFQIFRHFRYASFGFTFQQKKNQDLYKELSSNYERV